MCLRDKIYSLRKLALKVTNKKTSHVRPKFDSGSIYNQYVKKMFKVKAHVLFISPIISRFRQIGCPMKNFVRNSVPNRQKVSRFGTESIKVCRIGTESTKIRRKFSESVPIRQTLDNSTELTIKKHFTEFQLLN